METYIHNALLAVGAVAALLISFGFAAWGLSELQAVLEIRRRFSEDKIRESYKQRLGAIMQGDAYWFENKAVYEALRLYGEYLESGVGDIGAVRDKWRETQKTFPEKVVDATIATIRRNPECL